MEIWKLLVESNTINFLIVLSVILFIAKKMNISEKINNIEDEIKNFVDASTDEKKNSEVELKKIEDKIKLLPCEIEDMNKTAQINIESITQGIENQVIEKKKDIDGNANRILNLETKKFKSKIINTVTEASINLAKENAIKQLENNKELHCHYIEEAINEIDKVKL